MSGKFIRWIWRRSGFRRLMQLLNASLKAELRAELKVELKAELKAELREEVIDDLHRHFELPAIVGTFINRISAELALASGPEQVAKSLDSLSDEWRMTVRELVGLRSEWSEEGGQQDLLAEMAFLRKNQRLLAPVFQALSGKRVLYAGQAYYNAWYLSRMLRQFGWKADLLNWDVNPDAQIYYHGEDFRFGAAGLSSFDTRLEFYLSSLYRYDVFHFSNAHGISFGGELQEFMRQKFGMHSEIQLLKALGKKIVYSNNGCQDGVSQTAFSRWSPESVCAICIWKDRPLVCSDEKNLSWGKFRNSVADFQCLLGGNRVDYNDDARVHEVPEFYCLDSEVWHPDIEIPAAYRISRVASDALVLYHAVGNKMDRTSKAGVNIKSSHIYMPLIEKLKSEGMPLQMIEPLGIPNKDVRFLQAQADIFLEMLTFGWFGANAREAMMLGKPVVCYIRPAWLDSVREEIPEYADELPVVSATPATVEAVLRGLIADPERRRVIGERSRAFAVKWHSAEAAGRRFDTIYSKLLAGDALLREPLPGVTP
ncbi:glycosyltransferase [Polaromonas aquatica]|uniref:glycosyltransferase n=1 Tax=Polaromonas aquatica TaxID=332657 RepID=UPI003D64D6C4